MDKEYHITEKELRSIYDVFSREQLIDAIITEKKLRGVFSTQIEKPRISCIVYSNPEKYNIHDKRRTKKKAIKR